MSFHSCEMEFYNKFEFSENVQGLAGLNYSLISGSDHFKRADHQTKENHPKT